MAIIKTNSAEGKMLLSVIERMDREIKKNTAKFAEQKYTAEEMIAWKERLMTEILKFDENMKKIKIRKGNIDEE